MQPTCTIDPGTTALIVIDMQRDFCSPNGYAARAGLDVVRLAQPIVQIRRLLAAARAAGMLVVHTREGHLPDLSDCPPEKMRRSVQAGAPIGSTGPMGRLLVRGERGHDFIEELRPLAGEVVIDKPGYGAFYLTDLERVLLDHNTRELILCGVTTEVCVHSTLREAVDHGYACITVADGTAASDPALQAPALAMIGVEGGIFGRVATTDQLLAAMLDAHKSKGKV
jgi:biuret amidohydrolase